MMNRKSVGVALCENWIKEHKKKGEMGVEVGMLTCFNKKNLRN